MKFDNTAYVYSNIINSSMIKNGDAIVYSIATLAFDESRSNSSFADVIGTESNIDIALGKHKTGYDNATVYTNNTEIISAPSKSFIKNICYSTTPIPITQYEYHIDILRNKQFSSTKMNIALSESYTNTLNANMANIISASPFNEVIPFVTKNILLIDESFELPFTEVQATVLDFTKNNVENSNTFGNFTVLIDDNTEMEKPSINYYEPINMTVQKDEFIEIVTPENAQYIDPIPDGFLYINRSLKGTFVKSGKYNLKIIYNPETYQELNVTVPAYKRTY